MTKCMSLLIESIRLNDGQFHNVFYHEQRMAHALRVLFKKEEPVMLGKFLNASHFPKRGLYKCRVVYDALSRHADYAPYQPRKVERIKIVEDDEISYSFKYADRSAINRLFEKRDGCDDVLIIKGGRLTDCSYSNIVFRKGREWLTPSSPLLEGTMRQQLIDQNKVAMREIVKSDLRSFDTFKLINAMLGFDGPEIEVSNIVF